jgi:hypothetical protein
MRTLPRFLLKVVGVLSPVVIAACYGPSVRFREGKVIDKATGAAIAGAKVDCAGTPGDAVTSDAQGRYSGHFRCATLAVEAPGYQRQTSPISGKGDIALEPLAK